MSTPQKQRSAPAYPGPPNSADIDLRVNWITLPATQSCNSTTTRRNPSPFCAAYLLLNRKIPKNKNSRSPDYLSGCHGPSKAGAIICSHGPADKSACHNRQNRTGDETPPDPVTSEPVAFLASINSTRQCPANTPLPVVSTDARALFLPAALPRRILRCRAPHEPFVDE